MAELFLEDVLEKTHYIIKSEDDNFQGNSRRRRKQQDSKKDPLTELFEACSCSLFVLLIIFRQHCSFSLSACILHQAKELEMHKFHSLNCTKLLICNGDYWHFVSLGNDLMGLYSIVLS